MRGIIRTNMRPFLFYVLFAVVLSTLIWTRAMGNLRLVIGVFNGAILFLFTVMSAITAESREERHNGYMIMASLPVSLEEIVRGKFVLALAAVVVLAVYNIVFFSFFESGPGVYAGCVNIIMFASSLAIAFTGATYMVAFRFGTKALTSVVTGLMLLINVLGLIVFSVRPYRIFDSMPSPAGLGVSLAVIASVPLSVALFIFFMRTGPAALRKNLFT
jgi:hypothetical protein